jgi:hypothetical protein
MNIVNKSAAKHLRNFMLLITLLAGCAVAPPEPSDQHPSGTSYPDGKKYDGAGAISGERPSDIGPAGRSGAVSPTIERPPPAQSQAVARPQIQSTQPQATVKPAMPFPVQVCDAGGCFGPGGDRYSGGVGNIYLDSSGKPCRRTGDWMQCN